MSGRTAAGLALAVAIGAPAPFAEARVRLGHPAQERCAAAGCSYLNGKGLCVLAADGPDGLAMVLNGTPVKLKRKERLAVFRRSPTTTFTPGNRFMSVYDAVESSVGGVRVKILDTVVQPAGSCAGDQPDCQIVHFTSRVRIETPRDVIDFRGTGHCPAR